MRSSQFVSFFMGGFESADFAFWDGRRIDCIARTRHDTLCEEDYVLLQGLGLGTARDSFRWACIETSPGCYEWSSIEPMVRAAANTGLQVIWDLCHFGVPGHVDILARHFPQRFADFAYQAAKLVARLDGRVPWWCPINEISYWAYAAGSAAFMAPARRGTADLVKLQLLRAYLAAREALLAVDARARFVATDPLAHISEHSDVPSPECEAGFESWNVLLGRSWPALGGSDGCVDVIGVNYYPGNQWRRETGAKIGMGDNGYRPLRLLLGDVWDRYQKPILISETGAEYPNGPNWLGYIVQEVREAVRAGVKMEGICLYPVMDYPGWVDDRHCVCGPIRLSDAFTDRRVDPGMREALRAAQAPDNMPGRCR